MYVKPIGVTPITTHPDILWQLPADRPPGQHSTFSCLTLWLSGHLTIWHLTIWLFGVWRLWSSDSKVGDILTGHVTSNLPCTCLICQKSLILDFTFFHQDIICLLEICGKYHKKFNMKQAESNKLSLFVNILTIYVNGISIIFGKLLAIMLDVPLKYLCLINW